MLRHNAPPRPFVPLLRRNVALCPEGDNGGNGGNGGSEGSESNGGKKTPTKHWQSGPGTKRYPNPVGFIQKLNFFSLGLFKNVFFVLDFVAFLHEKKFCNEVFDQDEYILTFHQGHSELNFLNHHLQE